MTGADGEIGGGRAGVEGPDLGAPSPLPDPEGRLLGLRHRRGQLATRAARPGSTGEHQTVCLPDRVDTGEGPVDGVDGEPG